MFEVDEAADEVRENVFLVTGTLFALYVRICNSLMGVFVARTSHRSEEEEFVLIDEFGDEVDVVEGVVFVTISPF